MTGRDEDNVTGLFEDRLREWAGRPPAIPARSARTRVLASLPERSPSFPWLRVIAAASLLVALALAVWRTSPRPAGETSASAAAAAQVPVDPNVVVWVLNGRTTVYFVLGGGPARGGVS